MIGLSERSSGLMLGIAGWAVVTTVALMTGCGDIDDDASTGVIEGYVEFDDDQRADHLGDRYVLVDEDSRDQWIGDDGTIHFEPGEDFRQMGMMFGASSIDELEYRARTDDTWSDWKALEVYFSENGLHNGHLVFDEPVTEVQWRGGEALNFAEISFSDRVTARTDVVTADNWAQNSDQIPDSPGDVDAITQAIAPASMVTSREDWEAINPSKICGDVVAPYRMTIHHTYSPSDDGSDPANRMRQMQSYHINTNGWCDIGYHFVVAQSGEIFQGRSRSDRPGAHVGGENSGNVGIGMIGDYTNSNPPQIQFDGVVDMVQWVHDEHGVALNDDAIKGHREWPGQSTVCPGDAGMTEVDDIIDEANIDDGSDDDGSDDDDGFDDDDVDDGNGSSGGLPDDGDNVDVNSGCGCSATGGDSSLPPADWLLVMVVLGGFAVRVRNQR